ncbi:MAG: DUF59 domain-containing protein [Candidatus Marinimicrobia bacterium]|nr:DUF59 domain-containing protein [Candidatus Neomarinimicrobiota bacterium]MCH7763733.1 DUF59 domain-containing protein [Candidatus Neomarinimicrobiota bacterium]
MTIEKDQIIEVLKQCYDPEIPVDLWNLGLIYNININDKIIDITMSLTTPGCGMAQFMAEDIKTKVSNLDGVDETTVQVTFDPPWEPTMMTDEAKQKLGFSPTPSKTQSENVSTEWE